MLTRDRLGAFVAVLFGTAIVTLTLALLASAKPQVPDRFAAVAVAVRSPGVSTPADPFPESRPWSSAEATALAARLAAVPGVAVAVPDRRFYAQPVLGGKPVTTVQEAHGWASSALASDSLVAGRPAQSAREIVVPRSLGLPVGSAVTILTAPGPAQWTVAGLVDADRLYVSDGTATAFAPGVRMIGLTGHPDPEQVRQAAPGATILHGAALGDLESRSDARTRWIGMQVLTGMTALAVFACAFVIASTFALTVHQRRRELGLLRAVGATPGQVRRMIMRDAAVVGAIAGVAGTLLGTLAAPVIGRVLVDAGFEPESFSVGVHLWPLLAGLSAGPVIAVSGSVLAARRASAIGPLEALRQAAVDDRPMTRPRWIAGLLFAALGVAAGAATLVTDDLSDLATFALLGVMALVMAATVLAPAAVPPIVWVVLRPVRGPIGTVMRESALTGARRTASTAAPVLLTVAFAVFIAGNVQASTAAYASRRADAAGTGTVLIPDGTPGLTDTAAGAAPLPTELYLNGTVAPAIGLDPASPAAGDRGPALAAPDTVVIIGWRAAQLQLRLGDAIEVSFADGVRRPLRIVGVAADGTIPADFLVSRQTVREHDPSALATALPLPTGASQAAAVGARAVDVATYSRQADADEDRLVWIFTLLLIGVSVGYGALAVANTLFMATARRAPDYRLLRLAGATPRQVLLAVAGESTLVVTIGAGLGGGAAIIALWGATVGLRSQTGSTLPLTVPWPTAAAAVAVCLLLALAGSVLPARAGLRHIGPPRETS
ncbi:ABC transporter permease [Actinoplanes sp. NPDC026619]|uniref:ABC transporter permease n=1 Tax=Actinoplanes sp. NPDC026619 TaxID=3155798 RepID=UPI0033E847D6